MEFLNDVIRAESFFAVTIGIIVLFVGKRLNDRIRILREFSAPEPVTGGCWHWILSIAKQSALIPKRRVN